LTSTRAGTAVTAETFAVAGAGGTGTSSGVAGQANASSHATAVGSGIATAGALVQKTSSGTAQAGSTSNTGSGGSVSAYAAAPAAGDQNGDGATTVTTLGGGKPTFLTSNFNFLGLGTSWSYVTGLPTSSTPAAFAGGTVYGLGSMADVYGGAVESHTYVTTADFVFNYSANSEFLLDVTGNMATGVTGKVGFDSSILRVLVNGVETYQRSFASFDDWENFFFPGGLAAGPIDIGLLLAGGFADVEVVFDLTASSSSKFQFDYAFGTVPAAESATPLPAALPLFVTGLGALGLLGWRRKRMQAA
jgi:hypothetical protein